MHFYIATLVPTFREIFFPDSPPSFYRVFRTKGLLTARFEAELTKDKLYRKRKRKDSLHIVTNRPSSYIFRF